MKKAASPFSTQATHLMSHLGGRKWNDGDLERQAGAAVNDAIVRSGSQNAFIEATVPSSWIT